MPLIIRNRTPFSCAFSGLLVICRNCFRTTSIIREIQSGGGGGGEYKRGMFWPGINRRLLLLHVQISKLIANRFFSSATANTFRKGRGKFLCVSPCVCVHFYSHPSDATSLFIYRNSSKNTGLRIRTTFEMTALEQKTK